MAAAATSPTCTRSRRTSPRRIRTSASRPWPATPRGTSSPWSSKHGVPYHEKKLGQLFCDNKSKDILNMLLDECQQAGVELHLDTSVQQIEKTEAGYLLSTDLGQVAAQSLVIATGGLSIPTLGATGFGYEVARQFGHNVLPTRAGLVPFTFSGPLKELCTELSGTSVDCVVSCNGESFRENILFTHRGLSGPAILQISSFWHPGRRRGDQPAARPRRAGVAARPAGRAPEQRAEDRAGRGLHQEDGGAAGRSLVRFQADEAVHPGRAARRSPTSSAPGRWCRPAPRATAPPRSPWAASTPARCRPRPWSR